MSTATVATVIKMLEVLPDATQDQVVAHLREYLADLQSEAQWDQTFRRTSDQLAMTARQARQARAAGLATPLDFDRL